MQNDVVIVNNFITACKFMNQGSEKELKFDKLRLCVFHDPEELGKYKVKVYKKSRKIEEYVEILVNNLSETIKKAIRQNNR